MIYFDGYSQTDLFDKKKDIHPIYILDVEYKIFVQHDGWMDRKHKFVISASSSDLAIEQLAEYLEEKQCKSIKNKGVIRVAKNITEYRKLCSPEYCDKFKAPMIV